MFTYIFESIGVKCVLGLCGQVLEAEVVREVYDRMSSLRSYWKLPPCPMEPMPAGSKMDLPLTQAESINNSGSASVVSI